LTMLLVVTPAIAEGGLGRAAGHYGGGRYHGVGYRGLRSGVIVGPGYGYYAGTGYGYYGGAGYDCGPSGTYLGYDGLQHLCPSSYVPQ
jgi:hypothetical protein